MAIQGISDASVQAILSFRSRLQLHTGYSAVESEPTTLQEVDKLVMDLSTTLDEHGFTLVFDWQEWIKTLSVDVKDPALLAAADIDTVKRVITAHIRLDRFIRGYLASLVASGYFLRLLDRIETLNSEPPQAATL